MRKIIPVVATGAALAVAGTSVGWAALNKDVTMSVDGSPTTVTTTAGTVGELLQDEGIEVTSRDIVAPDVSAKVTDGTRVAVQFARQVTFTVDGQKKTIWTTATSLDQALGALGVNTAGADLSTSRSASIGREGLAVDVATLKTVTIKAAGKERQVKTTGTTVADALAAAKIEVDGDDELSVDPDETLENGAAFTWTKVDVSKETKKQDVAFSTVRKESSKLARGTTKVDTTGERGTRTLTFKVVRKDGKVAKRTQVSSKVTDAPRDEVVLVGTKAPKRPAAPKPATSSGSSSSGSKSSSSGSSGSSAPSVASGSVWDRLAQCESGGNWSINTGNGFYGGLQFTLSTWRGYGGTGMPHQASREQQIAVAKKVQAGQGWGAWPACTAKLGIR
ncbi:resuscitation-promoting factor [Microlunatus lacustris]